MIDGSNNDTPGEGMLSNGSSQVPALVCTLDNDYRLDSLSNIKWYNHMTSGDDMEKAIGFRIMLINSDFKIVAFSSPSNEGLPVYSYYINTNVMYPYLYPRLLCEST